MFLKYTCLKTLICLLLYRIAGCQNSGQDDGYCSFARDNFNYVVDEWAMKWRDWEPQK
jgi:hypothetical protein